MLRVEEALELCLGAVLTPREEEVALGDARGRVLAQPIRATRDSPPATMSAMDGVAVRVADLGERSHATESPDCFAAEGPRGPRRRLRVLETVPAGHMPTQPVTPGTCSWVMTGGVVPDGADAVVMREHVERDGDHLWVPTATRPGQHIRRQAEEFTAGTPLLPAGTELDAGRMMLVASQGLATVRVVARPRVAILSTGDELRAPGESCTPAQIYGSNATALAALVAQAGGEPVAMGVARDTLESTRRSLRAALATGPDLILTTGGVSVGDFDMVKAALAEEGAEMGFWKVRMKPGKPLAYGVLGGVPAVGLPGNPVSCQVGFWQFVRPLLRRCLGDPTPFLPVVPATLTTAFRKRAGRVQFLLVQVRLGTDGRWQATPAASSSSGLVSAMARADGFALIGLEATSVAAGDTVPVQLLASGLPGRPTPEYPWGGTA